MARGTHWFALPLEAGRVMEKQKDSRREGGLGRGFVDQLAGTRGTTTKSGTDKRHAPKKLGACLDEDPAGYWARPRRASKQQAIKPYCTIAGGKGLSWWRGGGGTIAEGWRDKQVLY